VAPPHETVEGEGWIGGDQSRWSMMYRFWSDDEGALMAADRMFPLVGPHRAPTTFPGTRAGLPPKPRHE
jgi:hypothetical protein